MKLVLASFTVALFASTLSIAHEGHDHGDGGKKMQASQGGTLKEGQTMGFELVTQGSDVLLYPMKKDGSPIAPKDMTIKATAQAPKKPKTPVDFKAADTHFKATLNMKASYRQELQVEAKAGGKTEKFVFQIEPQG